MVILINQLFELRRS